MEQLTGFDRFVKALNNVPLLGRFVVSFFPEWRRRRVEDVVYMGRIRPLVDQINEHADRLRRLGEDALRGKTEEFRRRMRDGFRTAIAPQLDELMRRLEAVGKPREEAQAIVRSVSEANVNHLIRRQLRELDDSDVFFDRVKEIEQDLLEEILPEAFAVVKEACRRHCGQSWDAAGSHVGWEMVPFDVQLAGAMELHDGNVVEMATGEGKTLVAVMPLYLNALWGHGAHLVTVNDYLARRDSQWMGRILEYLGLTVGCLDLHDPGTEERRAAYHCDVTYGTNNEFGFDYLRDNMAMSREAVVQRGHAYAIIDEVDSILIDEARTPLIISGPVDRSTHQFDRLKVPVQSLVRQQMRLVGEIAEEADRLLAEGRFDEAGERLMWCSRGAPKHPRLAKLFQEPRNKKLSIEALNRWTTEKRMPEVEEHVLFTIDEKGHSADLTDGGRSAISPNDPNLFVLSDLVDEIAQIDARESDPAKSAALKAEARRKHQERSEELHNISQLLRAYMIYEKDVDYVVQDGRVIIVDEFTGRLMVGRRWSDGLHQAVEAKEGVKVERETQTLATITIQNYFRMYEKLAGMTGTAETEAGEFDQIYKMAVQRIPTNQPVRRNDADDVIYKTTREKYNAIIEEIEWLNSHGAPVLVGTVSVDASETIARMLKRRKIPCSILNAKQHQREAEIVAEAGQRGSVTIATNMAGRGTDIKLGEGVIRCCKSPDYKGPRCSSCPDAWRSPNSEIDENLPTCGLHVIGSERHDSRRIDRQLRGRSGRQGDPGHSRFFLSLEDNLLRLFGSERIANILTKWGGLKENEEIQHPLITRQIGKAQSKVEAMNFDRRKHTLEYDDVMNKQRDLIYGRRARALFAAESESRSLVLNLCTEAIEDAIAVEFAGETDFDLPGFVEWVQRAVPYVDFKSLLELTPQAGGTQEAMERWREGLTDAALELVAKAFDMKAEMLGPTLTLRLSQFVILQTIDQDWRDHLLAMDELRSGIGLRGYAQVNPLHEYQREAYQAFEELMGNVTREIFGRWFRLQVVQQRPPGAPGVSGPMSTGRGPMPGMQAPAQPQGGPMPPGMGGLPPGAQGDRPVRPKPFVRDVPKVKPNDPCPCGSGKKYKKCHGS